MPTKVAVIGAGGMLQYHAAGFKEAGAEIVALVDMNEDADVAEMLDKSDADAVSVIVPNKFHAPLAIQCLKAGKHVFCEKPPALSAAEVEEMIAVANESGKRLKGTD